MLFLARSDVFQGVFAGKERDLLLEALDGGQEFEDHKEDENEAGQDHGIDIAFDADELGQVIRQSREHDDDRHTAPDYRSSAELHEGLPGLMAHELLHAFIEHVDGDEQDDELVDFHRVFRAAR